MYIDNVYSKISLTCIYTRKDIKHVEKSFIKKGGVDIGRPGDKGRDPNNNSPEEVGYGTSKLTDQLSSIKIATQQDFPC